MPSTKWEKLRAYAQKDYSEFIDFPVELVGKDGVIRRYTYEESLLVYQKRIESSHQRYRDADLAEAEIDHCYKRIEQLKRSWRQLTSSRAADGESSYRPVTEGEAAEACKRFVRSWYVKALAGRIPPSDEPVNVYLTLLERQGALRVFYVSLQGPGDGHLLYVFAFQAAGEEGETARRQYAEYVRILENNARAPGTGVERLLGRKANEKYGFILTGSSPDILRPGPDGEGTLSRLIAGGGGTPSPAAKDRLKMMLDDEPDNAEAHYALGVMYVNESNFEDALEALTIAVTLQPFHLGAHLALSSLCDHMENWEHAEPYCLMATRYFPNNERVFFNLGLVYMRQGRYDEATEPLMRCMELDPDNAQASYFLEAIERGDEPAKLDPPPRVQRETIVDEEGTATASALMALGRKKTVQLLPLVLGIAAPLMLVLGYLMHDVNAAAPAAAVGAAAVAVLAAALLLVGRKN